MPEAWTWRPCPSRFERWRACEFVTIPDPLERGFVGTHVPAETVRVSATDSWLRLDAHYGAVLRRWHALLPLLV
jgi:hypothetical protein